LQNGFLSYNVPPFLFRQAPMPLPITPHAFEPLTDAEYALLVRFLPPVEGRRGRPPQDRRRTLDAIFWVACSKGPWKDLPDHLGRPDTASRALRRWAATGHMNLLLHQVATARRDDPWRALAWRIARAWRRVSRVVPLSMLVLAKRLRVPDAMPAANRWLPDPLLSEIIQSKVVAALKHVQGAAPGVFAAFARMIGRAGGNHRYWRLR
jgi:transposase